MLIRKSFRTLNSCRTLKKRFGSLNLDTFFFFFENVEMNYLIKRTKKYRKYLISMIFFYVIYDFDENHKFNEKTQFHVCSIHL